MKFAQLFLTAAVLFVTSAHAANKEWVTVEVKVKSHHGTDEKMKLKILKEGKAFKLIVDDFVLPQTRIFTNRQNLETILNYTETVKNVPCGKETFTYVKKFEGKSTKYSGCPTTKSFQALRNSFRNISAIK